jgi:hypothetical protein
MPPFFANLAASRSQHISSQKIAQFRFKSKKAHTLVFLIPRLSLWITIKVPPLLGLHPELCDFFWGAFTSIGYEFQAGHVQSQTIHNIW